MKLIFSNKSHNTNHRLARAKSSIFHKTGKDFTLDWLMMLSIGGIAVIMFVGVGYMKYMSSNSSIDSPDQLAPFVVPVKFSEKKLDLLLAKFDEKKKIREAVVSGKFFIPDPGM